jgi:hypothetical protein
MEQTFFTCVKGRKMNFMGQNLWISLHSFAFYYTEGDYMLQNAFVNWINQLANLLPCARCRQHLRRSFATLPLTPAILSSKTNLFTWTWQLHNIVNHDLHKPEPHLTQAIHFYQQLPLAVIGRAIWNSIHSLCLFYHPRQRTNLRLFLESTFLLLPVSHWRENVVAVQPSLFVFFDRDQVFLWSVVLHNRINEIVRTQQVTYAEARLHFLQVTKCSSRRCRQTQNII